MHDDDAPSMFIRCCPSCARRGVVAPLAWREMPWGEERALCERHGRVETWLAVNARRHEALYVGRITVTKRAA